MVPWETRSASVLQMLDERM